MRRILIWTLPLFILACAPTIDTCKTVLPLSTDNVSLSQTPSGAPACTCITEGVMIMVQPIRSGLLGWRRGPMWIDGEPVTEAEFATKLEEAKMRKQVEATTARVKGAAEAAISKASAIAKGIADRLKKK